jgi:putative transcriptional regulator
MAVNYRKNLIPRYKGACDMAIILRLDRVMADQKISLNELADRVGITNVNLSNLKTGKVKAIRFTTLNAICRELSCQPGDILEYEEDAEE